MANATDPLLTSIQGSDPQNLMEYITRQKIYDNRFWKEECFGLSAADVLEKAVDSIHCIGGTFGGNQQPTKFLCLVLKLLQIQPDTEVILEFIRQDSLKYVRALGLFYLRLTGKPVDIYEELELLYSSYSKLRYRGTTEWKLIHMDEFAHDLLTATHVCGIALPRLPQRTTLQDEGFLDEGPRKTELQSDIEQAGGLEDYLLHLVKAKANPAAIALWNRRHPQKMRGEDGSYLGKSAKGDTTRAQTGPSMETSAVKKAKDDDDQNEEGLIAKTKRREGKTDGRRPHKRKAKSQRKESKKAKYGSLFKKKSTDNPQKQQKGGNSTAKKDNAAQSIDYWNDERKRLGLGALK